MTPARRSTTFALALLQLLVPIQAAMAQSIAHPLAWNGLKPVAPGQNAAQNAAAPGKGKKDAGKLKIDIECVFRYTTVTDCNTFKEQFLAGQEQLLEPVDSEKTADLELSVTDQTVDADNLNYVFTWTSHLPGMSNEPWELPPLTLATALDATSTLVRLITAASKGLFVYYTVSSENTDPSSGTTTVTLTPPAGVSPNPGKPDWIQRMADSPWYFNVGINGSASSAGSASYNTSSRNLPGSAEVAYFSPNNKVELDLTGSVSYSTTSEPNGEGGKISASNTSKNSTLLGIYQVSDHWDVAVLNFTTQNPGANTRFSETAAVGAEWALVPFRTTQNKELSFRLAPGFETMTMEQPNYLNHLGERLFGAMAQVYFYWVTMGDKLIFSASATDQQGFKYANDVALTTTASVTYQLNRALGFNASVNYAYSPTSLTFPGNPDYSNPLQTQFLSGAPGSSWGYSFGAKFTLGNVNKYNVNRRWKTN